MTPHWARAWPERGRDVRVVRSEVAFKEMGPSEAEGPTLESAGHESKLSRWSVELSRWSVDVAARFEPDRHVRVDRFFWVRRPTCWKTWITVTAVASLESEARFLGEDPSTRLPEDPFH